MVATGELIQLPLLTPLRVPVPERRAKRHYPDTPFSQHRIYRRPLRQRQATLAYGPSGLATIDPQKGRQVNIYA